MNLADAIRAWTDPAKAKVIGKDALLAEAQRRERIPSVAEEQAIRAAPFGVSIDPSEWGGLCLFVERVRRGDAEQQLADEARQQIEDGLRMLDYTADRFLHWPWRTLDDLVGGMAPGTLHYVVCPSKGGKTTLCRSATAHWIQSGKRVYYAGLEMTAKMLRMMYAADAVGVDPGDVVTGAWLRRLDVDGLRLRLREAWLAQDAPDAPYQRLRFAPFQSVNRAVVQEMMTVATDWGADVIIVDHVDHVDGSTGTGGGDYTTAQQTQHLFLEQAQRHDATVILTSQMNTAGKLVDLWRDHRPLRFEHVKFGALKLEVATTMVGFYRPVKAGMTKEERQMVEARERTVYEMLEPGVNAFNLMASRPYGSRIGNGGVVGWERGRIVDAPASVLASIEAAKHRIRTNRDV